MRLNVNVKISWGQSEDDPAHRHRCHIGATYRIVEYRIGATYRILKGAAFRIVAL